MATQDESQPLNRPAWWKHAVFYEAYVDRFAGTFANFARKLDYLKALGIDCVHILPHYPSPMADDGYDVSDYRGVREELGTLNDFEAFVEEAHGKNIRVIIDFVLNHVSIEHPWFVEARSSRENPKRNYFLWSDTGTEFADAVNSFPDIKPKNWIYDEGAREYYFSTFHPAQADLNWDNPAVFTEMTAIIDFWMERGVDGFRLDAAAHLMKREGTNSKSLPETHALLKRIRAHIEARAPEVVLLAEVNDVLKKGKAYFGNDDECHLVYNFPLVGQMFLALIRNADTPIKKFAARAARIPPRSQWAIFLRHHDEMALTTADAADREELLRYFDPKGTYRFASGTSLRLANMFHGDKKKILDAYRLLFSMPGSPIIYYGDEIAMENGSLPADEKDTRKSLREKFDWAKADAARVDPNSLFAGIAHLVKDWKGSRGSQ